MCEWKASSDLMSVMVDMMRIVALWGRLRWRAGMSYEEIRPIPDCTALRVCWEKLLFCPKEYPQEKLKDCTVVGGLIAI